MADMVYCYGLADGNASLAARHYTQRFPIRRLPNSHTFSRLFLRLKETGSVTHSHSTERHYTRPVELEQAVLRRVDENASTSIGRISVFIHQAPQTVVVPQIQTATRQVGVPVPQPYHVTVDRKVPIPYKVKKVPVPVEVPKPYTVTITKKVAVPVEVPKQYNVEVTKHEHVPVEVPKPYSLSVTVHRKVPYQVKTPVYVKVQQQVPHPVPQPYAVHVPKPYTVNVPQTAYINEPVVHQPIVHQ
ncbi:mantle protein-like [Onthophagus taurus]|uniref:mantle protein-like n=1 Tax=Onthophagus taurus TaxID=166361 RepID=UPI0039BDFB76